MIRRVFFAFVGLSAAIVILGLGLRAGPAIETALFPIRGPQSVRVIERTTARVCYAWTFVKRRAIASDNEDSFLEINGVPSGVVAPYDMDTGYPWGIARFAVEPRPEPYTLRYCIALPPAVRPTDTIRVRQVAFYPGALGLWRLTVPFPDVVSEGLAP